MLHETPFQRVSQLDHSVALNRRESLKKAEGKQTEARTAEVEQVDAQIKAEVEQAEARKAKSE